MTTTLQRWCVRLVLGDGEAGPLSRILIPELEAGIDQTVLPRMIGREGYDENEPHTITFDVSAGTAQNARVAAQHRLGEMKRRAGLRVGESAIAWVARLSNDVSADSLRFLSLAKQLAGNECPEMAVAAAQIHLEVQVRILVEMTAEIEPSPILDAIAGRLKWAPHDPWLRPILESLYDIKMDDCGAWNAYKAHVTRRNHVVHRGQSIDDVAAKESIAAVSALWEWLNNIANEKLLTVHSYS
jgi:hypothetical protein